MGFNSRDQVLLAEIEAVLGTQEAPTPAAHAIEVGDLSFAPDIAVDTGESLHTGSIDAADPTVLGGVGRMNFFIQMKGSGTPATPPRAGALYRACSMSETILAAAVTGTAQGAGTGSDTIQLAAADITADNLHRGFVIRTTGGTGPNQTRVIVSTAAADDSAVVDRDWDVAIDGTTTYSIDPGVQYGAISLDQEAVTLWAYQNSNQSAVDSQRRRVFGAMSPLVFEFGPRRIPLARFAFQGQFVTPDEIARPTGVVYDPGPVPAYRSADAVLNGKLLEFTSLQVSSGGTLANVDDPAAEFGVGDAAMTARRWEVTFDPNKVVAATQDFWPDFTTTTKRHMVHRWGTVAGKRLAILFPALAYDQAPGEANIEGRATTPMRAHATGADGGVFITHW